MKLTKKQRLAAYKYALREQELSGPEGFYICILLHYWIYNNIDKHENFNLEDFPEFLAKKPKKIKNVGDSWWNTRKSRIKALKTCIEELSPKKK